MLNTFFHGYNFRPERPGKGERDEKMTKKEWERKGMKSLMGILGVISLILCMSGVSQTGIIDEPVTWMAVVIYLGLTTAALFYSASRL